jgi:hypothetical protein
MHIKESIYYKIFQIAENDDRIRAVLLNGSRANPNIEPDKYQDYDLLLVVRDFETFLKDICNNYLMKCCWEVMLILKRLRLQ